MHDRPLNIKVWQQFFTHLLLAKYDADMFMHVGNMRKIRVFFNNFVETF